MNKKRNRIRPPLSHRGADEAKDENQRQLVALASIVAVLRVGEELVQVVQEVGDPSSQSAELILLL